MPIPPIEEHVSLFDAGPIQIGVEYRLLNDAIAASADLPPADGDERGPTTDLDDRGVSLHVFGMQDGERREFLRFDCFEEDPHYHYVSVRDSSNVIAHVDPVASGDPLTWALERIRTRLPQMLEAAGAHELAAQVEVSAVEDALPRITEAAFRLRYRQDGEGDPS